MITYANSWRGPHYERLVQHFERFSPFQRRRLSKFYECEQDTPQALADHWCTQPDAVRQSLREHLVNPWVWDTLEHLVLEHDVPLLLDWMDGRQLRALIDAGIVRDQIDATDLDDQYRLPGAMAAVLGPMIKGVRPSLLMILCRQPMEVVHQLAKRYELIEGPGITSILALSEYFSEPASLDHIIGQLPGPEWLGGALVVLELGGVCYWQEVFGAAEMEAQQQDEEAGKVVPLMRKSDRNQERDIAQTLLDFGLIHRIAEPNQPHDLVAIPEEIWQPLWMIGRMWLMDWTAGSLETLRSSASKGPGGFGHFGLQPCLKWLVCEFEQNACHYVMGEGLSQDLIQKSSLSDEPSDDHVMLGLEIGVFEWGRDGDELRPIDEQLHILDHHRGVFVRQALASWVNGSLGQRAEVHLAAAIGIDERWRAAALDILNQNHDPRPTWMAFEGVPSEMTGAGYLRPLDDNPPEIIMVELHSVAAYIGVAKMLWLDLLCTLQQNVWLPIDMLTELFQLCCACALFEHLWHLLEHPGLAQYLPVQRASFLTDGFHVTAFQDWMHDTLTHLLVPLGVAIVQEEQGRVCLDTRHFNIESPFELPEDFRERLVMDILQDPNVSTTPPSTGGAILGVVQDQSERTLSLSLNMEALLKTIAGRAIQHYDGKSIHVERP